MTFKYSKYPEQYLKDFQQVSLDYYNNYGVHINWKNPKKYSEKICIYKISDEIESLFSYADKYQVRSYVEEKIGQKYLIPLIGIFENSDEMLQASDLFPDKFVLKATHGSGWNLICRDKCLFDWKDAVSKLDSWLSDNYYINHGKERQYKNIIPKIICEKYLDSRDFTYDYKIFCFSGMPKYIQVDVNRFTNHKRAMYSVNWDKLPFTYNHPIYNGNIDRPKNLDELLRVASKLSSKFEHVRVDLYNNSEEIYFGELTFTSGGGYCKFKPVEWDIIVGNEYKMNKKTKIRKKGVVYTCITGSYDELHNHTYHNPEWDYVCFTDDLSIASEENNLWEIRPLAFSKLDPVRNQRWHKVHPHKILPDYEKSIFIDANIDVLKKDVFLDVEKAIKGKDLISVAPHPDRNCIYEEHEACVKLRLDDPEIMKKQIQLLKERKYPKNNGLFETGIVFRMHNDKKVKEAMRDWWYWISNHSRRDQLSFNYVLWKNGLVASKLTNKTYRLDDGRVQFWHHNNQLRKDVNLLKKEIDLIQDELRQALKKIDLIQDELRQALKKIETLSDSENKLQEQINELDSLFLIYEQLELELNKSRDTKSRLENDLKKIKTSKFFLVWQFILKIKKVIYVK